MASGAAPSDVPPSDTLRFVTFRSRALASAGLVLAGAIAVLAAGPIAARVEDWLFERELRDAATLVDPEPRGEPRIANGRALYRERCITCHGERGRGDGALAAVLEPKPADLLLHVPQHPDGELFLFISRGTPRTAMPAWRGALTERERWDLVHYLRVVATGAP